MPCDQARLVPGAVEVAMPSNWLRVLGTAKRSQMDHRVPQQLHPIVPLLHACKAEQQALARIFPRQGPHDAHAYRVDGSVEQGLWVGSEQIEARAQIGSYQTRTSMTGGVGEINCGAHQATVTERLRASHQTSHGSLPRCFLPHSLRHLCYDALAHQQSGRRRGREDTGWTLSQ